MPHEPDPPPAGSRARHDEAAGPPEIPRVSESLASIAQPGQAPVAQARPGLPALAFAALGVVYGDIGTSPLYALKACFAVNGVPPTSANVYGILSMVFWALILVVSIWYLGFILRADNRGEGGILALMALATFHGGRIVSRRGLLVALGLLGTALLYGDGMITPAISVLGAIEGLQHATPALAPFVIPVSAAILLGLFMVQRRGTAGVARLFSPLTCIWLVSIAGLGVPAILKEPLVWQAINPAHAARFFIANGWLGLHVLGSVFLTITGAEALYADVGHFGRRPIRAAWFALVLPALLLNYFGQGALLLRDPGAVDNPFYALVPTPLLYPMVAVATAAAIVASQAIISGVFSLTSQAQKLGYLPRMTIVHTSHHTVGQIYVPSVNSFLMVATIGLVLAFRSTDNLAQAYGIAVSATMPITTLLFYVVARRRFGWSAARAGLLCGFFFLIDISFFGANALKIPQGGWFPIVVAAIVWTLMSTWREGIGILQAIGKAAGMPLQMLLEDLGRRKVVRVPGTAVFMSNAPADEAPLVLLHHLKHNKVLHERVVLLSILPQEVPTVAPEDRIETHELGHEFYQVLVRFGFMETPNVAEWLAASEPLKGLVKPAETTYYLGRQTLVPTGHSGMTTWRKKLFRFMARNAQRATAYFRLPPNRVVELGAQVRF
jgi:KUP system potassium uptake protein